MRPKPKLGNECLFSTEHKCRASPASFFEKIAQIFIYSMDLLGIAQPHSIGRIGDDIARKLAIKILNHHLPKLDIIPAGQVLEVFFGGGDSFIAYIRAGNQSFGKWRTVFSQSAGS